MKAPAARADASSLSCTGDARVARDPRAGRQSGGHPASRFAPVPRPRGAFSIPLAFVPAASDHARQAMHRRDVDLTDLGGVAASRCAPPAIRRHGLIAAFAEVILGRSAHAPFVLPLFAAWGRRQDVREPLVGAFLYRPGRSEREVHAVVGRALGPRVAAVRPDLEVLPYRSRAVNRTSWLDVCSVSAWVRAGEAATAEDLLAALRSPLWFVCLRAVAEVLARDMVLGPEWGGVAQGLCRAEWPTVQVDQGEAWAGAPPRIPRAAVTRSAAVTRAGARRAAWRRAAAATAVSRLPRRPARARAGAGRSPPRPRGCRAGRWR